MPSSIRCAIRRGAAVVVWIPALLLVPVLSLHGSPAELVLQLGLILAMAAATLVAVLTGRRADRRPTAYLSLVVLASATVAGVTQGSAWLPTWILPAITVPAVLRGPWVGAGILLVAGGSMWATRVAEEPGSPGMWGQGLVVLLAGAATAAFIRLIETIEELRRTRKELARSAVAEERERFSRDLHDLLGHTLSVMVVKAQAVRRLAERDPAEAAAHAEDIERVGRDALQEVRQAVDAMRALSLADELDGARRALGAAGIHTEVTAYDGPIPDQADQAFAWVVREGTTNVLRHSGAANCRFRLHNGGRELVLTVADDGVGGPAVPSHRDGGLDGLRRRLVAAGGALHVAPSPEGFRLTARMPVTGGVRT